MIEAGFWFLLGFFVASWLAWRAQAKQREKALKAFQEYKTEILRLLETAQDLTEVRITIIDNNGELKIDTSGAEFQAGELELEDQEDPPAATSSRRRKDLH